MAATAIILAWVFGMLSGALAATGLASVLTSRMIINPTRIDWSAGEAQALGVVLACEGLLIGLVTVIGVVQWAAYSPLVQVFPLVLLVIGAGGFIAVSFVGRHHNNRGPLKKW